VKTSTVLLLAGAAVLIWYLYTKKTPTSNAPAQVNNSLPGNGTQYGQGGTGATGATTQ
jgi:hypothetical protein